MRKQIGNPQAALTALLEGKVRLVEQSHLPHECLRLLLSGNRLAMQPFELRLVIERVDLTEAPLQKNLDHAIALGRMVRRSISSFAGDWIGRRFTVEQRD